jgi:hypothetical protein
MFFNQNISPHGPRIIEGGLCTIKLKPKKIFCIQLYKAYVYDYNTSFCSLSIHRIGKI